MYNIMKQIKSIFFLLLVAFVPLHVCAADDASKGEELNIPEIVLEHLSDSYEWHIVSYGGKHLSIPLPVIVRSEETGDWHICTSHNLPENFFSMRNITGRYMRNLRTAVSCAL